MRKNGVCMQSMSQNGQNAYKREAASEQWMQSSRSKPDMYEEQEDQWAILRHEVEEEDMQQRVERQRSDWNQRDTDDETISSHAATNMLAATHHVDIVVAGVGGVV